MQMTDQHISEKILENYSTEYTTKHLPIYSIRT